MGHYTRVTRGCAAAALLVDATTHDRAIGRSGGTYSIPALRSFCVGDRVEMRGSIPECRTRRPCRKRDERHADPGAYGHRRAVARGVVFGMRR